MSARMLAIGLVFGLAIALSFAEQWNQTPAGFGDFFSPTPPQDLRRNWYPLALAAIGVCFFANLLVFVAAKVFHVPQWEKFAQAEFFQVTVSALLIATVVQLLDSGFDYIADFVLPRGSTTLCQGAQRDVYSDAGYSGPIKIIQCKLQDKLNYIYALYAKAVAKNKEVETLTTMNVILFNIPIFYGDWIASWHDQMEKAHYIANAVIPMAINVEAQYMFMDYIANNMLAVLLPVGIILRIIPVFRGIGGLLIAIALGFYMVFPIAYIMLDPTTVRADPGIMIPTSGIKAKACYTTFAGIASSITLASLNPNQGGGLFSSGDIDINALGREMARLQIETIFIPFAALGAAIVFIQAAAPFFGGDSGEIVHFIAKVI